MLEDSRLNLGQARRNRSKSNWGQFKPTVRMSIEVKFLKIILFLELIRNGIGKLIHMLQILQLKVSKYQ